MTQIEQLRHDRELTQQELADARYGDDEQRVRDLESDLSAIDEEIIQLEREEQN